MRKIILIILLMIPFLTISVAENTDEIEIIYPGEGSLSDTFDDIGASKFMFPEITWAIQTTKPQYGDRLRRGKKNEVEIINQGFDYNAGIIKSSFYRFVTKVHIGDSDSWSGFQIDDTKTDKIDIGIVKSVTNDKFVTDEQVFSYYFNGKLKTFKLKSNDKTKYIFEIILYRKALTNNFQVQIKVTDESGTLEKIVESDNVVLNSIYPSLWAENNKRAIYYDYKAYHKKSDVYDIVFSEFYQNGEQYVYNYQLEDETVTDIKLMYSKDEKFEIGNDDDITMNGYKTINITSDMKQGGYIGIFGNVDGEQTYVDYIELSYLAPPANFHYVPTGDSGEYKFTWDDADNVTGYRMTYVNSSEVVNMYPDSNTYTNTQITISDPDKVSIVAKSPSQVPGVDSISDKAFATEGPLEPVTNFVGSIVNKIVDEVEGYFVDLSWNEYKGASEYKIGRNNGTGSYSIVATPNNIISYSDPLTSQFLKLNYRIQAVVDSKISLYSDVLTIENKVKNLFYNFDDTNEEVNLYWEPINEATSYKIFISKNEDMTADTIEYLEVDDIENAEDVINYSFGFETNDKDNRYVQIQAVNGEVSSGKTDVMTIDYSRNNMVKNLKYEYSPNTYQVKLSWDALEGATMYALWIGDSVKDMELFATVPTLEHVYKIKNTDLNTLYFAVQGLNAESSYIRSNPMVVGTFTKDYVENLSINFDTSDNALQNDTLLRWNSLYRADGYQVYINDTLLNLDDENDLVLSNTLSLDNIQLNDSVKVRGVNIAGDKKYYSQFSNVVTAVDSDSDVKITTVDPISNKLYGTPLDFELDFSIQRDANKLYDVEVEIVLNSITKPGETVELASFIYPEIQDVSIIDTNGVEQKISYSTEIKTGQSIVDDALNNSGYSVLITIPDGQTEYLEKDSRLRVKLKTDLRFNKDVQLLDYAAMELPFHIEEQIKALETGSEDGFFADNTKIDAIISFKLSADVGAESYTKYQSINFDFVDKELIIGE